MRLGIIVHSNDAETIWNAFRLANFSLSEKDDVRMFLLAKGVEYESLSSDSFKITEQAERFIGSGGKIFACGTCLKSRNSSGSTMCPMSTMKDLHALIRDCDKVLTF